MPFSITIHAYQIEDNEAVQSRQIILPISATVDGRDQSFLLKMPVPPDVSCEDREGLRQALVAQAAELLGAVAQALKLHRS
ncbi:MAG: hypothetical protein F4Z24_05880 [Nitrospira sp. SB0666_bin_27]|nr:hypothetical protein [Nitrospira sp. SB0666_bin_27]MYF24252.1 hypothetical protein [Nitrospira sp. SB0678_bin_10]